MSPKGVYYREMFFTSKFWDGVAVKIVETLVSVKVWGLIAITVLPTWLLVHNFISGGQWAGVVSSVYATIFAVREIYKVGTIMGSDDKTDDQGT